MTDHKHKDHKHHQDSKRQVHKDWRAWAVVLLMLAAMAIYVMTMDESIQPGGVENEVPAAVGE